MCIKNEEFCIKTDELCRTKGKFGQEIDFRHDLEDFVRCDFNRRTLICAIQNLDFLLKNVDFIIKNSYGLDRSDDSDEKLEERMCASVRDPSIGRQIPVILLCFGGGPGTLSTVIKAMHSRRPILFFYGSGRVTDLICGWREIYLRGVKTKLDQEEIYEQQLEFAVTEISLGPSNVTEADVEKWRKNLDEIVVYEEISMFDFRSTDAAAEKLVMGSKKNSANPLLPLLLSAIFDSKGVLDTGKVPLAIRYNNHEQLTKRLQNKGLIITDKDDPTKDSRHLVYAAFYDQAKIVSEMIATGYSLDALDQLIALEIKQEAVFQSLHSFGSKFDDQRPPNSWRSMQKKHQKMKLRSTSDATILSEWKKLKSAEKDLIIDREVKRVGWDKLPFLPGWTYAVVAQKSGAKIMLPYGTLFRSLAASGYTSSTGLGGEINIDGAAKSTTGLSVDAACAVRVSHLND